MDKKRRLKDGEGCPTPGQRQRQENSELIESPEELKHYLEELLKSKFDVLVSKLSSEFNVFKKEMVETVTSMFSSRLPINVSQIHNESEVNPSEPSMYLKFTNEVNSPAFTDSVLQGQDGRPIKVALFGSNNAKITGPLSSLKIEIVPLLDEFGDNKWTKRDFRDKIAQPRPNNGPLLKGKLFLELKDGEVSLLDIRFEDISSRTRTGMYRLGVRAEKSSDQSVREGISNAFAVKAGRGKVFQKLHPPLLDSKIEMLEQVAKGRAEKLQKEHIYTVRDFLHRYFKDEAGLLEILGIKKSDVSWRKMVDHARECSPDDNRLYSYPVKDLSAVFFFNSLYEFVGAKFGGVYIASSEIDPSQKTSVSKWKKKFYQNMDGVQFDHEMVNNHPEPVPVPYGPMVNNQPVPYEPIVNNMNYDHVALAENNLQTTSPYINLAASYQNQFQVLKDVPGSSTGDLFHNPSNRHIIEGQTSFQFWADSSAMNFSTQHVSLGDTSTSLGDTSTQQNEASVPFFDFDASLFKLDNWFGNEFLNHDFSFPMRQPDIDASLTFDRDFSFHPEMPLPVTDQPMDQPDLPDQAIDLPNQARRQWKWPKVVAVVKWKVMLSFVRENRREIAHA